EATLAHYLHDKALLLVLDNFEQVLPAAEDLPALLDGAPGVKVLATSRIALRLYNEHEHLVPPLQVPDPRRLPSLERLQQYEAVRLFIQRAQAVKPDFQVTSGNAPAVAEVCARLDGLPLAIELAAARTKMLPPEALLQRLSNRLRLLTGGARDLPARQQTLRAAIDWSYSLLQPAEQTLFARLAVFMGGRTLEAVEAVCNAAGDLDIDPFEGVASLLDKSLLRQEEGPGGEPRFVMLETIHEYARERLEMSGDVEDLRQRHAEYFRQVAEAAEVGFWGLHQGVSLARLAAEQDNLRAALGWALERREGETALRLAGGLGYFWQASGQLIEGRQWLEAALATMQQAQAAVPEAGSASAVRAKTLFHAAYIARLQGDFASAHMHAEEALALTRASEDKRALAWSLENLAMIAGAQGDFVTARERNAEALALQRELGDPSNLAVMLNNEGWRAYLAGDDARALALLEESLALFRQVEDTTIRLVSTLETLGLMLIERAEHARARTLLTEALHLAQQYGDKSVLMWGLEGLACLAAPEGTIRGEPVAGAQRAARIFGAAEALRETQGELLSPDERSVYERHVAFARAHMQEPDWSAARAEGRAMPLEQAVAYALEDTAALP
ncbi:MAG TPA: tetratricopeptide repeat protein, partial [Herpetosiphonaceae bacterium]|nr:tetratricopeptide repeat protein [Herpetosiphonaceae bacterium]